LTTQINEIDCYEKERAEYSELNKAGPLGAGSAENFALGLEVHCSRLGLIIA